MLMGGIELSLAAGRIFFEIRHLALGEQGCDRDSLLPLDESQLVIHGIDEGDEQAAEYSQRDQDLEKRKAPLPKDEG